MPEDVLASVAQPLAGSDGSSSICGGRQMRSVAASGHATDASPQLDIRLFICILY